MGCCDSCLGRHNYSEIPKAEGETTRLISAENKSNGESYQQKDRKPDATTSSGISDTTKSKPSDKPSKTEFDMTSSVFEGLEIRQKFTNKSSYDSRFIWVNTNTFTIHLSQYMTKDRRHKEASMSDVTSVVAGPPAKLKHEGLEDFSESRCLTINFKRGGGIDLLFKTEEERILWFNTLKRLILMNNEA